MGSYSYYLCLVLVTLLVLDGATSRKIFTNPKKSANDFEIIGGQNTTIEEHPYQIAFKYIGCSGSIISENYILTAAHCIKGFNPVIYGIIQAGSTYRHSGYTEIEIAEFIVAPAYNPLTSDMDVGLLKTKEPIKFTKTIKPIKLPNKERPLKDNTMITVSGWGTIHHESGPVSENLMAVDVPVSNFEKCNKTFTEEEGIGVTATMFCAGYEAGGKDACQGDSGGPAVQDGMIVGIVSWGYGCARPNRPGVYTNVAAADVRDFINKQTGL